MTRRLRLERGFSLVEALVALFILSLMLLGTSRLVVEQSRRVALARVESQLWQIADSVLARRSVESLVPPGLYCATDAARCELALDPTRYVESWPVDLDCPGCGLTLVLETPSGYALEDAAVVRESVSVEWSSRGRRRGLRLGRIRS